MSKMYEQIYETNTTEVIAFGKILEHREKKTVFSLLSTTQDSQELFGFRDRVNAL